VTAFPTAQHDRIDRPRAALRPVLDRSELEDALAILAPPHGLLGSDEGIDGQDPAGTARELDPDALGKDLIVAGHGHDLTKAVVPSLVALQAQAGDAGRLSRV